MLCVYSGESSTISSHLPLNRLKLTFDSCRFLHSFEWCTLVWSIHEVWANLVKQVNQPSHTNMADLGLSH